MVSDIKTKKDWYDSLSAENKKALKKGIEDHKNERTLTEKEFWKKFDQKRIRKL